jgi:integrin alpha FG-GAP repeat containing protein 1
MVQRTGQAGHGHVLFVQNNFYYDAFFLKAIGGFHLSLFLRLLKKFPIVLNGACDNGWCYSSNGTERYHVRPSPAYPKNCC